MTKTVDINIPDCFVRSLWQICHLDKDSPERKHPAHAKPSPRVPGNLYHRGYLMLSSDQAVQEARLCHGKIGLLRHNDVVIQTDLDSG